MLITTYAVGSDDQELLMVSEAVFPGRVLDLVIELRGTEITRLAAPDTPTFTCLGWSLDEPLVSLG